ncbi:hypothetical protein CBL_05396 [Carabus blaptoides fortunei]
MFDCKQTQDKTLDQYAYNQLLYAAALSRLNRLGGNRDYAPSYRALRSRPLRSMALPLHQSPGYQLKSVCVLDEDIASQSNRLALVGHENIPSDAVRAIF